MFQRHFPLFVKDKQSTNAACKTYCQRRRVLSELHKTPLHAWHKTHGAKMVPFAGWEMPVQYTGIIEEHLHTRTRATVFDICHMGQFKLVGSKARECLSKIVTHDLTAIGPGRCRYGFILNHEGGILDDLLVYCLADDVYMLVINAARIPIIYDWIEEHITSDIFFEDISEITAKIDLQGPEAPQVLNELMQESWNFLPYFSARQTEFVGDPLLVSRTGYTGELGYEFYLRTERAQELWERLLQNPVVKPGGLGARDTLRLEMGLALYGQDIDEQHTPTEAGMGFFLKSKADYIGKAAGKNVRECLIPLALPGKRAARHNDPVCLLDGQKVGVVTSGSIAPSLGHAIALAYVQPEFKENEDFVLGKAALPARRVSLPFYKKGTARTKL